MKKGSLKFLGVMYEMFFVLSIITGLIYGSYWVVKHVSYCLLY